MGLKLQDLILAEPADLILWISNLMPALFVADELDLDSIGEIMTALGFFEGPESNDRFLCRDDRILFPKSLSGGEKQ